MMIPIAFPGFVTQSILPAWKYSGRRRTSFHNTREPTGNKSNIFLFLRYFRQMMTCRNQIKSLTAPRQKRLLRSIDCEFLASIATLSSGASRFSSIRVRQVCRVRSITSSANAL